MRISRAYCVVLVGVFLLSFVCLSVGINKVRIASTLPDPISKIPAQDESLYSHIAIHMATEQNWLTPMFLGRYLLYKPPLLVWLSGLSMKVLGVSLFSLRLPLLLAGALAAMLIFIWLRRLRPDAPLAAAVAFLLLVSNRQWHVFYRICQTDGLLATAIVGSLLCLLLDPRLEKRLSLLIFAIFTAAAILSKSVAGFLPLGALLVFCALQRGGQRPSRRRAIELFLLTGAFALPWHLYQLIAHPRWFWADYVQLQLLSFGLNPPSQVSAESHVVFYLKRLFLTDPVLVGFALVATPSFVIAARRRGSAGTTLLFSWLAVSGIGLLAFQYRNAHYLLSVIPALCILAAGYGPLAGKHRQLLVIAGLCTLFFAKVYFVNGPWRLNFREDAPLPAARLLRDYCERDRPNQLILVSPDDEFYSAVLPLPRVRYCFIDPANRTTEYGPHFVYLGITVMAEQFIHMDQWRETFRQRLHRWGLDSTEPLATAIIARNNDDVLEIIRTHPTSDFYLPASFRIVVEELKEPAHEMEQVSTDRILLLARAGSFQQKHKRSWRLPKCW